MDKKIKIRILCGVVVLVLLLILFFLLLFVMLHNKGSVRYPWEPGILISGRPGSLPGGQLPEFTDPSNVTLRINSRPVFKNGESKGSLLIENPSINELDMFVKIYLGKDQNGELIYETDRILPGYYIDYDKLMRVLDKGEYEAIAYITFMDGDTPGNTASVNINIIIES